MSQVAGRPALQIMPEEMLYGVDEPIATVRSMQAFLEKREPKLTGR